MNSTNLTLLTESASVTDDTSIQRTVGVIIGVFDITIGSVGNLLTFFVIWTNSKLHKPFFILVANLCVIDFLTATVMMPFNVTSYATKTWPFGEDSFTCAFMAFSYYCCGYSSIVCLLAITANRFVGIVYRERYAAMFTKRRLTLIIITCWLFAPTFLSPFFFFNPRGFAWNKNVTLCVFNAQGTTLKYMQFTRVLFQLLPLLIMITLYGKIFLTSRHIGRAVTKISMRSNSDPSIRERSRTSSVTMSRPNHLTTPLLDGKAECAKTTTTNFVLKPTQDTKSNCSSNLKTGDGGFDSRCDHQTSSTFVPAIALTPADETTQAISPHDTNNLQRIDLPLNNSDSFLHMKRKSGERNKPSDTRLFTSEAKSKLDSRTCCDEEICCSAPSSPLFGVRNFVSSRSLHSTTSSPPFDSYSPGCKRSSSPHSGSPALQRANNFRYMSIMQKEAKRRKSVDRRLLRISVMICTVFMILFLPSVIINLIPGTKPPGVHMLASVVTWLNSCVNPIIYCFMNERMRHQYKLLLRKAATAICRCLNLPHQEHQLAQQSFRSSTRTVQRSFKRSSERR